MGLFEPSGKPFAAERLFFFQLGAKMASAESSDFGLSGMLYLSADKGKSWGLLTVPNPLVRGVHSALHEPGIELPPCSVSGRLNAHITVLRPDEIDQVGGPDALVENRGKNFQYRIVGMRSLKPEGWAEMERAWILEVESPDLEKLRKSYGLSARPKNNQHDFHITVAVRRKKVPPPENPA